ncbi:uridine monophosphate kinase [Candidatus Gracilibacteria bacterium]|nr:uridine monophosphate kinase [Candidatus Gracilibacteria bacterium]
MKRILLKISGEALSGDAGSIHADNAQKLAQEISKLQKTGLDLVLVFGGGNIYRGSDLIASGVNPADSHNMSMLSTVFNCVTVKNFLSKIGIASVIMDALHVEFLEKYSAMKAREYIAEGKIVICSSGIGVPYFTTDTTGVTRALELGCDTVIKLTKVDGVYDSDPVKNPQAQKYESLSYNDFLTQDLKVLDQTAIIMARDNRLPIHVMNIADIQKIPELMKGEIVGTKIL